MSTGLFLLLRKIRGELLNGTGDRVNYSNFDLINRTIVISGNEVDIASKRMFL